MSIAGRAVASSASSEFTSPLDRLFSMPLGMTRRDLPLAIATFLVGVVLSGAAAATWLLTVTGGGGGSSIVVTDTAATREAGSGRGEIAVADRAIVDRLTVARAPTAPIRGG